MTLLGYDGAAVGIHLNAFSQCSPCPQAKGQWKHPEDQSSTGYRQLDYWVELARTLENGLFDALFFADIHGTYDVYGGSRDAAVRHAVQIPCHDPTVLIPALALETQHLGFATTYSTTYHPPYQAAKLFSTLDHLSGGRVGWNVVTSYLRDAEANGLGQVLPHDERYDRADEYMEVVYKLWEQSWDEGAVVRDAAGDVHTDPARVREIRHAGRYFRVLGPHLCEPSPQRTPVIYQAGSSPRGLRFAARHGEALFVIFPNPGACRRYVEAVRAAAREEGRDPGGLLILLGIRVTVGRNEDEARRKRAQAGRYHSPEGQLALFGGWSGIDLAGLDPNQKLDELEWQSIQSIADYFRQAEPQRVWTVGMLRDRIARGGQGQGITGSPIQVADELERWIEEGGVDGFNLLASPAPGGYGDFVEFVVPELQRRNLFRTGYEGATLREHYFGPGRSRLPPDHPGHPTRLPPIPGAEAG